ncbi:hypothetical protein KR032_008502, partial [Drosophila birchii]
INPLRGTAKMNAFWLLFLLANGGWAAPAAAGGSHRQHHHLEIGVQGDMPTLVDAPLDSATEVAASASPGLELRISTTLASSSPRPTTEGISSSPESSTERSSTERMKIPENNSERITAHEIITPQSSTERSFSVKSSTERSPTEHTLPETSSERIFPERKSSTEGSITMLQSSTLRIKSSTSSTSPMSTPKPPAATSNATTVTTTQRAIIPVAQTDLPAMQLLDLEHTAAPPPLDSGHDGLKLTRKKQLQQQHFPSATSTTTMAPSNLEMEMERIPTTSTTKAPHSHHSGYLGPIFMGEKTFSVVHPLKKPQPASRSHQHVASIESQLRNGQLVEILAPTALLEQQAVLETSTATPAVERGQGQGQGKGKGSSGAAEASSVSTTVFQVPELQTSTTRLPTSGERTESKISDIQIEVYDSTVDSIVASTNFRDSEGFYPPPAPPLEVVTSRPETPQARQELPQERFTQYVIDRADVSTQPASGGGASGSLGASPLGQPEPAAIEIHINVSEAFGSESEDLEFSYRQPEKPSKLSDEILVVEIIDSGADNSSQESGGGSASSSSSSSSSGSSDPIFTFRNSDAVAGVPPAVRPPQQSSVQDADELFMADLKDLKEGGGGSVPRPPPPPPPPPLPRKPSIDRDSDTIFYISNTEVKVGESLPTMSPNGGGDQQRKFQLENQFFPASYVMDQSQRSSSAAASTQEEDIILSPHHSSDSLKIYRSDDGAPPLDVTYVGESVIEVEQQPALGWSSGSSSTSSPPQQQQQQDIVIQPAVLPDLAIGVPVIGELPPQIELKEIDYMPGELGMGVYENDLQGNSIDSEPDAIESSIQYGGDLIDDGAGGGFDGVEGSYPFESAAHRQQQQQQQQQMGSGLSHLPSRHSASHLHREQLPVAEMVNATLLQRLDSGSGSGSGSGSASAMAPLLASGRSSNATALSEEPLLADYDGELPGNPFFPKFVLIYCLAGFFNLFAVSMGLIIVILPSALLVSMYCAIKYVLNKNSMAGAGGAPGDDSEQGQDSAKHEVSLLATTTTTATSTGCPRRHPQPVDPPTQRPQPAATGAAPLGSQGRFLECLQFRFSGEPDDGGQSGAGAGFGGGKVVSSGSVTKMTLKDNHLIVVTEERHDISRNARETKMHTDKDGVFVVEVARGIDSGSTQPADSTVTGLDATELPFDTKMSGNGGVHLLDEHSLPPSHEQVQIHAPPQDFAGGHAAAPLHLIEEAEEQTIEEQANPAVEIRACTGLSQSDLSSTSSGDSNKRYSYGNQELYVIEQPGYATSSPTAQPILASPKPEQEQELEKLEHRAPSTEPEQKANPPEKEAAAPGSNPENPLEKESSELPEKSIDPPENAEPQPQLEVEMINEPRKEIQEKLEPDKESPSPEVDIEPEANYDSLMSLPAPPSTDEINSELGDYTLLESNQLDSLPPPPPPLAQEQLTTNKPAAEEEKPIIGNGNASGLGKVGEAGEPATLTPPASPPASPPPPQSGIYGNGNGLSNGMHSMVDVNGS